MWRLRCSGRERWRRRRMSAGSFGLKEMASVGAGRSGASAQRLWMPDRSDAAPPAAQALSLENLLNRAGTTGPAQSVPRRLAWRPLVVIHLQNDIASATLKRTGPQMRQPPDSCAEHPRHKPEQPKPAAIRHRIALSLGAAENVPRQDHADKKRDRINGPVSAHTRPLPGRYHYRAEMRP